MTERHRRSPMLQCLPRREAGAPVPGVVVKLRTTVHGGASRSHPERFCQLTVPADIADQLEPEAKFRVIFEGNRIIYELIGGGA